MDQGQAYQGPWRMNASRFLYVATRSMPPRDALRDCAVALING